MSRPKIVFFLVSAGILSIAALWLFALLVERSVIRDAERQSVAWAEYAVERLTRIEELARGAPPTTDDLRAISEMETFGHVFRFKLFGPDGALRFVSEDPLADGPDLGDHNPTAREVTETLRPYTVVADGTEKPDRPDLYSETYLPIVKDGRTVGIVETYLDQTETRSAIRADYAAFGLGIVALILAGFAGPVTALVMVLRRLRLNNRLLDAERARAVAADRSKTDFLANVSHELRTPLNGIVGLSELLEDQPLDEDGRESLNVLRSAGAETAIMIDSLLDMTRIEAGDVRLSSAPFDPVGILADVVTLIGPDARRKGLKLDLDLPDGEVPEVVGDEHVFRQICLNLVGNAVKFTEDGHVRASRRFDDHGDAGSLVLDVDDTGIGILEEDRSRIFERFARTREGLNIGASGTGLGLSITRSFVELMGGEIHVESTAAKGSTFTATLPFPVASNLEERLAA